MQTLDKTDKAGTQSRITDLSSAQTISASSYASYTPRGVVLQALTKDIWVSVNGTTATATNGFRLYAGTDPQYYPFHPADLSFLEVEASAELRYVIVSGR